MPVRRWNVTVVDSPRSEPLAVAGDVILAVRTPRSRDFVSVEAAPVSACGADLTPPGGVRLTSVPPPCLHDQWQGEVHVGDTVHMSVADTPYRLTLLRLAESPDGSPWVVCDFCLERD